jgi:hypothetical protein
MTPRQKQKRRTYAGDHVAYEDDTLDLLLQMIRI